MNKNCPENCANCLNEELSNDEEVVESFEDTNEEE